MATNLLGARQRRNDRWIAIMCACVLIFVVAQVASAQKKKASELPSRCEKCINVGLIDIQAFDGHLQSFYGQLSTQEQGAMTRMLLRAASEPSDDPKAIIVIDGKHTFVDLRGTGVFADENGDRGGGDPGRPPGQGRVNSALGPGAIKADQDREPNRPPPPPPESLAALNGALGVRDPEPPPPATINSFSVKFQNFVGTLSGREKAVVNWLVDRAGRSGGGNLRAGRPTLSQALGITAFGSRAAGGGATWLLRFN